MSTLAEAARQWALIARVRGLRVLRRRTALALAPRSANAARAALDARETQQTEHARQRLPLLARCQYGAPDAALWREALVQHRVRDARLQEEVEAARSTYVLTMAELAQVVSKLRRETRAHEDAQSRAREIVARLRSDA